MDKKNFVSQVLGHDISWWVNAKPVDKLDDSSIEHIEGCIREGITQGQLCIMYGLRVQKETTGWWSIIDWKNIALELYNVTGSEVNAQKAKKSFDENWNLIKSE